MSDHTRVNPKTQEFVCQHCGTVQPIESSLTAHLEDQIARFNSDHIACPVPVFQPGDKVVFCGERATVIANYGDSGTVEIEGQGRMNWYWKFQGERVMPYNPFKSGGFERVLAGFEQIGKEIRGEKA